MANVTVSGVLFTRQGEVIDLEATIAEGTESNLTTNTTYSNQAMNVGDFRPGAEIVGGYVQGHNGIAYCYLLRQGLVRAVIPVCKKGITPVSWDLCASVVLQPGDIIRVMVNTAADRELAISCYTNRGESRIFVVTPSGAATNEPVDLVTGNSAGDTLNGQVILKAFCTSVDGNKIDGGGSLMLNEQGMPVGVVPCNTPAETPPYFSNVRIPVALNYKWAVVTSS